MTFSENSRLMRITASRPRKGSASLLLSRKRRRRSQLPHQRLLRLLLQRKRMILRRKRRRRRRLLSKCHPSYWCSGCVLSSTTPCKKDTCANATCPVSYTQSDNALVYQQIFLFLPLL